MVVVFVLPRYKLRITSASERQNIQLPPVHTQSTIVGQIYVRVYAGQTDIIDYRTVILSEHACERVQCWRN